MKENWGGTRCSTMLYGYCCTERWSTGTCVGSELNLKSTIVENRGEDIIRTWVEKGSHWREEKLHTAARLRPSWRKEPTWRPGLRTGCNWIQLVSQSVKVGGFRTGDEWTPVSDAEPSGPFFGVLVAGRVMVEIGPEHHIVLQLTAGAIFPEATKTWDDGGWNEGFLTFFGSIVQMSYIRTYIILKSTVVFHVHCDVIVWQLWFEVGQMDSR